MHRALSSPQIRFLILTLALGLMLSPTAGTQPATEGATEMPMDWTVDPDHSKVGFSIRHFLTPVSGRFNVFSGTIRFAPDRPDEARVEFTVQANSIDTNNAERDRHLRSADFFDVARYPTLHFRSRHFAGSGNAFRVTGDLSIHGVTREVTVPLEFLGLLDTTDGPRAGFAATFEINRKDYGITWNENLDQGGAVLGETVTIRITVSAVRPPEGNVEASPEG
jgi:polyisoprenoid-binding protein YceI